MKIAVFSLCEGDYDLGIMALLNSLVQNGFKGEFIIGYRNRLSKKFAFENLPSKFPISIRQFKINPGRHLGYEKPFFAQHLLELDPTLDGIVYADPDVLMLCNWEFIEKWMIEGVALCLDNNFPMVDINHPWRTGWRQLFETEGIKPMENIKKTHYHNSGFFGILRKHSKLLDLWIQLTKCYEKNGDTSRFQQNQRCKSVTGDQDLLAAALMGYEGPVATIGLEGMGFNGHYFILSHAIQSVKPWRCKYLKSALRGKPPSICDDLFWKYSSYPIQVFSTWKIFTTKISLLLAKLIGRAWKK